MERKKISVCMPTCNGEKYIGMQLQSILDQLSAGDEVIISDDRSSDSTLSIVESFNDPRIKVIGHDRVKNPYMGTFHNIYYVYRNVENALGHATGDYIFLADQDDVWLPGKVDKIRKELDAGADLIMHDNTVVDEALNPLRESYFSFIKPSQSPFRLLTKCFYQGASMAFTRDVMLRSLPFPEIPISHDHWIAYNVHFHKGKKNRAEFIREPLMLYRRHGNNVSPSSEKSPNSLGFKITYRFRLWEACLEAMTR